MKKVAIVMGSDSDLPIVKKAAQVLKDFGVPTELRVLMCTDIILQPPLKTAVKSIYTWNLYPIPLNVTMNFLYGPRLFLSILI